MERDGERIEITISSRFENIELVQVIAEHLCENAGLDEDGSHWIGMAVREAVANAIKHGNKLDVRKRVNATFELNGSHLAIKRQRHRQQQQGLTTTTKPIAGGPRPSERRLNESNVTYDRQRS